MGLNNWKDGSARSHICVCPAAACSVLESPLSGVGLLCEGRKPESQGEPSVLSAGGWGASSEDMRPLSSPRKRRGCPGREEGSSWNGGGERGGPSHQTQWLEEAGHEGPPRRGCIHGSHRGMRNLRKKHVVAPADLTSSPLSAHVLPAVGPHELF